MAGVRTTIDEEGEAEAALSGDAPAIEFLCAPESWGRIPVPERRRGERSTYAREWRIKK